MEFWLLGPLRARSGGTVIPLRRGKQRAVLVALLMNANRVVSVDDLAGTLWGASPPPSARVTVQNYVKRLRQALGDDRGALIRTVPQGYVISVGAGELDLDQFEAHVAAARAAAREETWQEAADRAGAALSLWRGEPLADVDSPVLVARLAPRLAEMRLQALETRAEADIHLGRQAAVIPELRRLAAAHPLREHLHGLLMLALYRDGRQADALAAYQAARQMLISELGCEPGPRLEALHQRISAGDPGLGVPAPAAAAAAGRRLPVPGELPADVPHFTGRSGELAALTALLTGSRRPGEPYPPGGSDAPGAQAPAQGPIAAIRGTAGVGKTALAVHWAHQVAGRFPDGQLYVNLRGFDPDQPLSAADALAGFLRALGVPGHAIPADEAHRSARYRSLLAGRRMLVLLDNAGSAEQVRPLLPAVPGCAVVVTSRDWLEGLAEGDGAVRVDLATLAADEAVGLLRALIGDTVDADPVAAEALAEQCARLPLALRVAAELALARPGTSLAALAGELADQERRLDLLAAGGDRRAAVRAVFSWSYRHLDPAAARMFPLLGLHPGPDLDAYAAAALTGGSLAEARDVLGRLARAHLVQLTGPTGPGPTAPTGPTRPTGSGEPARPARYGLHDLLRAYACELAAGAADSDRGEALTGLYDYYLRTASAAMDTLFPAWRRRRPTIPAPDTPEASYGPDGTQGPPGPVPPVDEPAAARAWLDAQRPSLIAAIAQMARHGWYGHATRLSETITRYLITGGYFAEAVTACQSARDAARRSGDRSAEAVAMTGLGTVDWWQGRLPQAADRLGQALELCRDTGDGFVAARALANLGMVNDQLGNLPEAIAQMQEALATFRSLGETVAEAYALGNLGAVYRIMGRYDEAFGCYRRALALCRGVGDLDGQGQTLVRMGFAAIQQKRGDQAAGYLEQALELLGQTGNRAGQAQALTTLGAAQRQQGRHGEAATSYLRALELAREIGDQHSEARALNGLGAALLGDGQVAQARDRLTAALSLASQIGHKYQQAHAHDDLAAALHEAGDFEEARFHWQAALGLYTELSMPETDQVRARLDGLLVS